MQRLHPLVCGGILLLLAGPSTASAQTLTEKLTAEDPALLAETARQSGNVVRGAILFHQGNINCAKCHRPQAVAERRGPDLSREDSQLTDRLVVESILQPSQAISQGFETVKLVTQDGLTIDGLLVEDRPDQVVLRSNEDPDQLVTIPRDEIEGIRPGTKSNMPEGLADQLKDRQQFLDLVHYVLQLRDRGPQPKVATSTAPYPRRLSPKLEGQVLVQDRNCSACHAVDANQPLAPSKQPPRLSWSSQWLNPHYMIRFLADPHAIKPGTSMPHLMADRPEPEREAAARALVHYLVSHTGSQFVGEKMEPAAVARGRELFHTVGCVACHAPRNESAVEIGLPDSVPLGDLSSKYNVTGLVQFLEDPLVVRPSGRMPHLRLTHWEAVDLASFLLQNAPAASGPFPVDKKLAVEGKRLFDELNCRACHTDFDPPAAGSADAQTKTPTNAPAWADLRAERGCLSGAPGPWPDFGLAAGQLDAVRAALQVVPADLTDEQQIAVTLRTFQCTACHSRNQIGGVANERNSYFQTTNLNLGEQGRIPPPLDGAGAKLKAEWMRDVLVNGRSVRPYMKTRMPQYGEANVGHLVDLFQQTDSLPPTEFATFEDQKAMRKMGLELAGNQGLNCVACHTYKYKLSDTMPAVDLTEMADRLKKDWFYQYMQFPQKFSPNTVMPSFWPGGVAIRKDLEGDASYQIEALWQYLIDGRQAGTPRGVVREPLEIVVTDTPQMLRRKYPGIGKRGIGIGYPGGVNLAFDAEQLRLGLLWKGKFADPAGVWMGQGSGNVRPMGRPVTLPMGPELDDADQPWLVDDGRPPQHQFQGYRLDKDRRPTLQYRFDNVDVQDFFLPVVQPGSEEVRLRRELTFQANGDRDRLLFRIGQADQIDDADEGWYSLGPAWQVRLVTPHPVERVDWQEGQRIQVPLTLPAGQAERLILEYRCQ
ncbi:MAG: hypothetical protein MK108_03765 [Mariniblastus sp.]|nr:hypothetical protein [Mariniblastus sp.]